MKTNSIFVRTAMFPAWIYAVIISIIQARLLWYVFQIHVMA